MFTIATVVGLSLIAFSCALEAYFAGRSMNVAVEALKIAHLQKIRIDRMQRTAHIDSKETKIVDYQAGWNPAGNWDDDFSRTSFIPPQTMEVTRVNWFRKIVRWLKG